jgi:hypothetical protein
MEAPAVPVPGRDGRGFSPGLLLPVNKILPKQTISE